MSRLIFVSDPPGWSPLQAWAYALGAPYHLRQGFPLNALPQPADNVLRENALLLKRDWGIESGDDLMSTLNWLGTGGHRAPGRIGMRRYCILPRAHIASHREELQAKGQEDSDAREEMWRLDIAQTNTDGIRGADLIAFDAARAVMLARYGCLFGWLTEQQLWDYILDVARDVQPRFASWAEYATDFQLSRRLWAGKDGDPYSAASRSLLTDERSPWRRLSWQLEGLSLPRPVRTYDSASPVWTLERWDS